MDASALVRITDPRQAAAIAAQIERSTASARGVQRVAIDADRLHFDPVNPDLDTALGRYGEVLGPRYVRIEQTPKSAVAGQLDLREHVTAPGDGVRWTLEFKSAETGEPITNGLVGAWMTAPAGYRGNPAAHYPADAFRGHAELDDAGRLTIVAHDPQPYEYPLGSGNILAPHIHGYIKGVDGHVDMPWEQLRTRAVPNDADEVVSTILVPPGHGRMVLAPWDDHADAVHAPAGHPDAGFILPSEPRPL